MVAILACEVITVIALLFVSVFNHNTLPGSVGPIATIPITAFSVGMLAQKTPRTA